MKARNKQEESNGAKDERKPMNEFGGNAACFSGARAFTRIRNINIAAVCVGINPNPKSDSPLLNRNKMKTPTSAEGEKKKKMKKIQTIPPER